MSDLQLISISPVHEQASRWFERASASMLGVLPCRRGCSSCCVGLFAVTVLDADLLQRGVQSLPPGTRREIQDRARRQVATLEKEFPRLALSPFVDHWTDAELDALADRFGDLPCAALAPDGSCQVYAFRPMTCRTMGIPTESDGMVQGACDVQTSVPVVRLQQIFREQETDLAMQEAGALVSRPETTGEELLMPHAFMAAVMSGQLKSDKI
jgi:Fe-S-cluster containining protein